MRDFAVMGITAALCLLCPFSPRLGLYGYYWFALMRPDILAWSGPNHYSLAIAAFTSICNSGRALQRLPALFANPLCRRLLLLVGVIALSVPFAVKPSLCIEPISLFLRMILMALFIPLVIWEASELQALFVVMAASIGLLAAKFGLSGLLAGGARFAQGYGGMLSDNNTMALAFVLAIPLCWFSRDLVRPLWAKAGMGALALLSAGGVIFTHSRGGALAAGTALLVIAWRARHRVLVGGLLLVFLAGAVYLVRDSFLKRMETIAEASEEASAKSRIILAASAVKMWLDYPIFGVGFTEDNEQELIAKYVPAAYKESYQRKVIHNTYLQMLVDAGIFALLLYVWLLLGAIWKMELSIRRLKAQGRLDAAAVPLGVQTALVAYMVGSTFLSRTSFDFFYILVMLAATWLEIETRSPGSGSVEVVQAEPNSGPAVSSEEGRECAAAAEAAEGRPWLSRTQHGSRLRMGRERRIRE
jgi:probable O-glycosylation ligase (exosortase A-associated)